MKKLVVIGLAATLVLLAAWRVILTIDTHLTYGRMWETPAVRPYEQPLPRMPGGVVPVKDGEALRRIADADELRSPLPGNDPAVIRAGHDLYLLYCAQCHGKQYDGNGTVGQSFSPLPTDLNGLAAQGMSEGDLFQVISYGIPGGRQPPLATTIDPLDRWRIVAFVESLGK
jgi:mono/diheme cytochrome c family protein